MMGQQNQVSEQSGGLSLPPSGGALPPVGSESLSQDAMIQQQLAHLAQMLEQQKSSPEGELPAQLAAGLAKALRRYSEEGAILPAENVEGPEGSVQGNASGVLVDGAQPVTSEFVADVALLDKVVETGVGQVESPDFAFQSLPSEADVTAVPLLSGESENLLPLNAGQSQGLEQGLPHGVEVSSQRRAEPAGEHPLIMRQRELAEQSISQLNPQIQSASVTEGADKGSSVASVIAPLVKNQITQGRSAQAGSVSAEASTGQSPSASLVNTVNTVNAKLDGDVVSEEDLLLRMRESSVDKGLLKSGELGGVNRKIDASIMPTGVEQQAKSLESIAKPLSEAPFGQKLESTLDAAQQLLQKVAATERAMESSSQSRMEVNAPTGVASTSAQNIMQPTQAQAAVTEGHTLMMPNQTRMNTPAWNNALGERAIWIAAQSSRVAEIRLDPPELGSLSVKININQDQVNLSFTSPHAHVRDAVEQSLPRLREMFAEQGLQLQDSSVSDQSSNERRERFAESENDGKGYSDGVGDVDSEKTSEAVKQSVSLVDYYA
jgi:flagellar hook-length control protein FliK